MSWTWKDGIATLTPNKNAPGDLSLTAGYDKDPVEVPCIEPTSTHRTLGAYISPSSTTKEAVATLYKLSLDYSTRITGSHFDRQDALYSFLLYYQPKVGYSFSNTIRGRLQLHTVSSYQRCLAEIAC